jgi:hypothetical protein
VRAWAWAITVVFTGLSVAGNVSHAVTADVPTRVGWALPPVVLALALGFGLGILKRQAAKYRPAVSGRVSAVQAQGYKPPPQREIMNSLGVGQRKARQAQQLLVSEIKAASNGHGDAT